MSDVTTVSSRNPSRNLLPQGQTQVSCGSKTCLVNLFMTSCDGMVVTLTLVRLDSWLDTRSPTGLMTEDVSLTRMATTKTGGIIKRIKISGTGHSVSLNSTLITPSRRMAFKSTGLTHREKISLTMVMFDIVYLNCANFFYHVSRNVWRWSQRSLQGKFWFCDTWNIDWLWLMVMSRTWNRHTRSGHRIMDQKNHSLD